MLLQIKINFYDIAMMGAGLGVLLGLVPLVLGFLKKERSYAVFGFLGSIIGGALLGVFLSIPIVAIFSWLILRGRKPIQLSAENTANENLIEVKSENSKNN